MTNELWWLLTFALYLLLDLYISSLTVGILRSRWIASLVSYQGAFIRDLSVFDWKRWSISLTTNWAIGASFVYWFSGFKDKRNQ